MNDRNAFLGAIIDNPADDLPRLVYADWLDENAGTVTCERCAGTGNAERAKFIRLQCAIGNPIGACERTGEVIGRNKLYKFRCRCLPCSLRRKEYELCFPCGVESTWWLEPGVHRSAEALAFQRHENIGDPRLVEITRPGRIMDWFWQIGPAQATYTRGFISEVRLPLTALFGGPCEAIGSHHRDRCDDGPIQSPNSQFTRGCTACKGTGRIEGCAATLFSEHPVTKVVLSGRMPWWSGSEYCWYDAARPNPSDAVPESANLPTELFLELDNRDNHKRTSSWPTIEYAHLGLSVAACRLGHSLAFPRATP